MLEAAGDRARRAIPQEILPLIHVSDVLRRHAARPTGTGTARAS